MSIACISYTGNIGECMDIQNSISEIYPEATLWSDQIIKDLDFMENSTIAATTRSCSKAQKQRYIHKEGQIVEKKIHQLIRR